jgi:hypothetical protein
MLNNQIHNRKKPGSRAQAMVEFAIVAPILFLMVIGIIEVGRMIFLYTAVTNASREAVRFGSAIGYDEEGELKYKHCSKIREVARKASYFSTIPDSAIVIQYDRYDPVTDTFNVFHTCPAGVDVEPGYFVLSGDRILVTVTGQYSPFTSLIPWGTRDFSASSARTILGYVTMAPGGSGSAGGAIPTPVPPTATEDLANPWTQTPSPTAGPSPTATDTPTATATLIYWTFTPGPSRTPTRTPTITPTGTITNTPTITFTPTPSFTPTFTPSPTFTVTPAPGCGQIIPSAITITSSGNTSTMSMTITNPHLPVTMADVTVVWNAAGGAGSTGNPKQLNLAGASLGTPFWPTLPGTDGSGNLTIVPMKTVTIPGFNATSVIQFTFDSKYVNTNGKESISITLSDAACQGITIKNK